MCLAARLLVGAVVLTLTVNGVACVDNAPCDLDAQVGSMHVEVATPGYTVGANASVNGNVLVTTWNMHAMPASPRGLATISTSLDVPNLASAALSISGNNTVGKVDAESGGAVQGTFGPLGPFSGSATGTYSQPVLVQNLTVDALLSTGSYVATFDAPPPVVPPTPPDPPAPPTPPTPPQPPAPPQPPDDPPTPPAPPAPPSSPPDPPAPPPPPTCAVGVPPDCTAPFALQPVPTMSEIGLLITAVAIGVIAVVSTGIRRKK